MAASGPTLAFVAYPDAVARMPAAPFWSVLFFFMLIMLGIDSEIVFVEFVITSVLDQWPRRRDWRYRVAVVAAVCFVSLAIGLVLTCPGGPYVLNLVDTFVGGWPLIIAALCEICMVSWVYGVWRLVDDVRLMLGTRPPNVFYAALGYPVNVYWWANWLVCTPLLLIAILVFTFVKFSRTKYGAYTYPEWAEILGWLMALFVVMWIPLVALLMLVRTAIARHDFGWLWTPTADWGPSDLAKAYKNEIQIAELPSYENAAFGPTYTVNPAVSPSPLHLYDNARLSAYRSTATDTPQPPSEKD